MDPTLPQLIGGALGLDRASFEAAEHSAHGLRDALLVLVFAGASESIGQCVVLFLNRVSSARFSLAVGLGGLALVLEAGLWIASLSLSVGMFGAPRPPFLSVVRVIGLAYSPLLLGVLVFLPAIGPFVARVLRIWVLLAAVVGTSIVFGLPPWAAAMAAGVGFLARWLLLRLTGGVADAVEQWFWRASTGQAIPLRSSEALLTFDRTERCR
jgi:hypothetical protein